MQQTVLKTGMCVYGEGSIPAKTRTHDNSALSAKSNKFVERHSHS